MPRSMDTGKATSQSENDSDVTEDVPSAAEVVVSWPARFERDGDHRDDMIVTAKALLAKIRTSGSVSEPN